MDEDKKSHLTPEQLKKLLMEDGIYAHAQCHAYNLYKCDITTATYTTMDLSPLTISSSSSNTAGEPFSQEEVDEMMTAAVDQDKGVVLYRDFVTYMLPEAEQS